MILRRGWPTIAPPWLWSAALIVSVATGLAMLALNIAVAPIRPTTVLELLVGWSFAGSGAYMWRRRPANRLGPIMVGVGVLYLLGRTLPLIAVPPVFTAGIWLQDVWAAAFAFFLLSFPTGRLRSPVDRAIVGGFLFVTVPLELVWLLFWEPSEGVNALAVLPDPGAASVIDGVQRFVIVLASIVLVGRLVAAWVGASAPVRRQMFPVIAGTAAILLGSLSTILFKFGISLEPFSWLMLVTHIAIPIAVLTVVLRERMARAAVADLVVELGETPTPGRLRDALAHALGDDELSVAYWSPADRAFVDPAGAVVELPAEGSGRAVTVLERHGRPQAAIIHDAILLDDPGLIASVASALRLAVENDRLAAEVEAQLDEVRASRARIVAAGDAERQRVERDLHDGAQQRLVSVTLALRLAQARLGDGADAGIRTTLQQAADEAKAALAELRELARGIHPQIRTEAGLPAAVESLAARSVVDVTVDVGPGQRYPAAVEAAAYFVVSEALANVAKYAGASRAHVRTAWRNDELTVEISDDGVGGADPLSGSGLRGLADRLSVIDGTLEVISPNGGGTRLLARIPAAAPAAEAGLAL
jgi:signal transduction histidine kinase